MLHQVEALGEGIAHPFAWHVPGLSRQRSLGSRRARSIHPGTRRHRGTSPEDASGRLLQSTFQRRTPESCVASSAEARENRAIHVTRLTSPDSLSKAGQPMTAAESESAVALTSASPDDVAQAPSPSSQDRFHRQPGKAEGFHSPERLPPTRSPPQALSRTPRFRLTRFSTSLRIPAEQSTGS